MRILSLLQPWASVIGIKLIETRGRATSYRGLLGIHASGRPGDKVKDKLCRDYFYSEPFFFYMKSMGFQEYEQLPFGKVIKLCELTNCRKIVSPTEWHPEFSDVIMKPPPSPEFDFGDYTRYRHGYQLANVRDLVEPIPCRGNIILWSPDEQLERQILRARFVNNFPKKR